MAWISKFKKKPISTNYSSGRGGRSIKYFTVHHAVTNADSLHGWFNNPNANASSHFYASDNHSEQYVDTANTSWANGNFTSNQESITCETRGDWRNGFKDGTTLAQLQEVMYQCLKLYPNLKLNYHNQIISTQCPAELRSKGYAQAEWNKALNRIKVEKEAAKKPKTPNLRVDIPDKQVELIRDANLWDMSFTSFANAKAVAALPKGTVVDVAGVYDHPLSKTDYYLSQYSWKAGKNWGISKADVKDYVAPKPKPVIDPVTPPKPKPEPVEEDLGAGVLPPISDVEERVIRLENNQNLIYLFVSKLFAWGGELLKKWKK